MARTTVVVRGTAMRLLLEPGDVLRVRPAEASELRWGDLVVLERGSTGTQVRRLLWRRGPRLWLGRDAGTIEGPVAAFAVSACVEAFQRDGGAWRLLDRGPGRARQVAVGLGSMAWFAFARSLDGRAARCCRAGLATLFEAAYRNLPGARLYRVRRAALRAAVWLQPEC